MNQLLITVHGIRTFGHWQERLETLLLDADQEANDRSVEIINYKFGYFSAVAFLVPPLRWLVVRRFRRDFLRWVNSSSWDRIDIVAHSFGTHVVAWALRGIARPNR